MEINIDDYLSERQKEEIAVQEWRKIVRSGMIDRFKDNHTKAVENYERVISNSIYNYLEKEIDSILGTDHRKLIEKGVYKTVKTTDYSFKLFRKSNAWDRERSPGQQVLIEALKKNIPIIEEKIKEHIQSLTKEELLGGVDIILERLIKEKFK